MVVLEGNIAVNIAQINNHATKLLKSTFNTSLKTEKRIETIRANANEYAKTNNRELLQEAYGIIVELQKLKMSVHFSDIGYIEFYLLSILLQSHPISKANIQENIR